MRAQEFITEAWSKKYKQSIDCSRPKGFSQRAHCDSRRKHQVTEQNELYNISEQELLEYNSAVSQLANALEKRKKHLQSLNKSDLYREIDNIMTDIADEHEISARKLHNLWMNEYDKKPDNWISPMIAEDLRKWFREKWVRFGPDGKIKGSCARGSKGEGKPKCLPQKKAHALGKKGRASAARRKRREDPNADRRGKAKNVATKSKK